jgi:hypothetical protein
MRDCGDLEACAFVRVASVVMTTPIVVAVGGCTSA